MVSKQAAGGHFLSALPEKQSYQGDLKPAGAIPALKDAKRDAELRLLLLLGEGSSQTF